VGESEVVALEAKVLLLFVERAAHSRPGCSHRVRRLGAQRPPTVLGRLRLGAQQQTHTCGLVQRVGQQRVPADVEVGSGDVDRRPTHEARRRMADEPVQRICHRSAVSIERQLRLRLSLSHQVS